MRLVLFIALLGFACDSASRPPATPGAPECKMGSNGQQTCGYNCKLGSGGSWFCASKPDGQCALNGDGTWTCP
jgi:hypothetical protein